jgi:NIMA (never in mitosis gene a)-related kinase 1/4/5
MLKYERGRILGKGSFGNAVLVKDKSNGKQYVVKEVPVARLTPAERESAHQEAEVWQRSSVYVSSQT